MISCIYFSTGLVLFTVTAIFTYNLLRWPRKLFKRPLAFLHLFRFYKFWAADNNKIGSLPHSELSEKTKHTRCNWSPSEILKQLGKPGVFPIALTNGWELCVFEHGLRVWCRKLTRAAQSGLVFGTCTFLKVQPKTLLNILTDTALLGEWNPGVLSVNLSQTNRHLDGSDVTDDSGHGFCHDILMVKRRKKSGIATDKYERYWNYSSDGVGWLLKSTRNTWTFYLLQPNSDLDQCLLNVVNFNDEEKSNDVICRMFAMEISCLREYLITQDLYISKQFQTSFTGMSERFLEKIAIEDDEFCVKRKLFQCRKFTKEEKRFMSRSEIVLSAYQKDTKIDESMSISNSSKSLGDLKITSPETVCDISGDSENSRNGIPENGKTPSGQVFDSTPTHTNGEITPHGICDQVSPSGKVTTPSPPSSPVICEYELISKDMLSGVRDGVSDREESPVSGHPSSNESESSSRSNRSLKPAPFVEYNAVEYITLANHTAADLIAEVHNASSFAENVSLDRQRSVSGEWLYHGLDNGVTILKKSARPGSTVQSYLGKGVIDTTPDQVWNIIRNPQARFMYDESLKKLSILNHINERVKTVHCYHEIQQLFRKVSWDTCVLQTERIDGDRFILAFQSVNVLDKQGKRVTRAKILPSGWIVEPFERLKNMCSIVTYVAQMDFGVSQSAVEDIVAKQPLAIVQLRNYLKPSIEMINDKISFSVSPNKS